MLHYAVVFFVIALIAALFGFSGIAAGPWPPTSRGPPHVAVAAVGRRPREPEITERQVRPPCLLGAFVNRNVHQPASHPPLRSVLASDPGTPHTIGVSRGIFRQADRSRPRHEADRSDHRASPPRSRVVGLALEAARRPRAQPTELRARDRREQGSERSCAGNRRPSTSDRAFVPRLADSCVFPDARIAPSVFLARRRVGVTSHVNV